MAKSSSVVLSVRVSPQERSLLETVAEQSRTTVSDFVRRKAIEAAETDLLQRRVVTIAEADWERFEAWAAAPAGEIPPLRRLAATPPVWME